MKHQMNHVLRENEWLVKEIGERKEFVRKLEVCRWICVAVVSVACSILSLCIYSDFMFLVCVDGTGSLCFSSHQEQARECQADLAKQQAVHNELSGKLTATKVPAVLDYVAQKEKEEELNKNLVVRCCA